MPKIRWPHRAPSNLWSHKVKPRSFYKRQAEEQQELRKRTDLRHWGSTSNPHQFVFIFLLLNSHCSSSSLLLFDLSPFSPSLLTSLIHILHYPLQKPLSPHFCYSLLPQCLSHFNKCFCESATEKGSSFLSPLMLHSIHRLWTIFIPNQSSSLHQSHLYCWSFSCHFPPALCPCWEKEHDLWAGQGSSATPYI